MTTAPAPATGTASAAVAARPSVRQRIEAMPTWVGALIGVGTLVVLWWLASGVLFRSSGSIPSPFRVLSLLLSPADWAITLRNLSGTVSGAAQGFVWGNIAALALAVVVLLLPVLEQVAIQIAVVTYCIPLVAIGPILVIVFGRTFPQGSSIVLAGLSVFFTTVVGALLGLRAAPAASVDLVRAYGGTAFTALRKVRLVAALPNLLAALKIAAPAAFLGAVLAEYLGSGGDASLGRALIAAQSNGDAPRLWYLALISGGVAGLGYAAVNLLGRLVTPWSSADDGRGAR